MRVFEELVLRRRARDRDLVAMGHGHVDRDTEPVAVAVTVTEFNHDVAMHDAREEAVELRGTSSHMSFESVGVRHSTECALQG